MLLFDVSALIAAHRIEHPFHEASATKLKLALASAVPRVTIPDVVWAGLIRICTNPRIFEIPSTIGQIRSFCEVVRKAPGYLHLTQNEATIDRLLDLCEASSSRANLVTDAYIAVIALDIAATVVTFDRDFRRFDGLKILDPSVAA